MTQMFDNAYAFNHPLNGWDTSSVTAMDVMFMETRAFNQPLDNWDVALVQGMDSMFRDAQAFNQDLCDWKDQNTSVSTWKMLEGSACSEQTNPSNSGNWCVQCSP